MRRLQRLIFVLALGSIPVVWAAVSVVAPASPQVARAQSSYSPFVLEVRGGSHFDHITFKEVGAEGLDEGERQLYYEALAQALGNELEAIEDLGVSVTVHHDLSVTHAENHLACQGRHLYADVWRSTAPERWGFSLWSGCNAQSQFAWNEVPVGGGDVLDEVHELAASIAADIASAERTGCAHADCPHH